MMTKITLLQNDLNDLVDTPDGDVTLFQEIELLSSVSATPTRAETEDLSSAMDLLNQLNGRGSGETQGAGNEPTEVNSLEADDELYQSLFGRVEPDIEDGAVEAVESPAAEFVPPGIETAAETGTEIPIAEIAEISDLFFSGMGDPAEETEAEAAIPPKFSEAELSQSVEIFLLKVPDPEPTAIATPPQQEVAPSEATPPETIASLSDLIPDPASASQIDEPFEENTYEPARSEESLLVDAARPPAMLDLDALPDDARQLLESDLSRLEFSDSVFDLSEVSPIQVQEDMTLFDDSEPEHSASLLPTAEPDVLPALSTGLDLKDFDFSTSDPSVSDPSTSDAGLSLENFAPPHPSPASIPETSMPQDHSSTPITRESSLTEDTGEFNAFSFDGLDDELFEPSSEPSPGGRSLESADLEDLFKKKRSRVRGERRRGFGR